MDKTIANLLTALAKASEVVIFTGAGLSADSGIPTFRDGATGLWANIDPEEVASIEGFRKAPEKVWAWHEAMRALFAKVRPNAGHEGIAALESLLPDARVTVITQNIDGLHQASGSTRVIEIHGSALRIRCHRHCGFVDPWQAGQSAPRQCPSCGALARPDVVWFGEALDEDVFSLAAEAAFDADIFFTVGTSAIIQPAASLPMAAKEYGALLVEINPHQTPFSEHANYSIRAGASEFFPALRKALAEE
ncbi:SIR2 family NAD-dependent protein deacylase [Propionivibrio sp.]|uniref:SIR2 family NAD-dependent protein deacylase n=1 Tax=Propionivibrio sp. TaxID=2212460 RepID=UPI003BF1A302